MAGQEDKGGLRPEDIGEGLDLSAATEELRSPSASEIQTRLDKIVGDDLALNKIVTLPLKASERVANHKRIWAPPSYPGELVKSINPVGAVEKTLVDPDSKNGASLTPGQKERVHDLQNRGTASEDISVPEHAKGSEVDNKYLAGVARRARYDHQRAHNTSNAVLRGRYMPALDKGATSRVPYVRDQRRNGYNNPNGPYEIESLAEQKERRAVLDVYRDIYERVTEELGGRPMSPDTMSTADREAFSSTFRKYFGEDKTAGVDNSFENDIQRWNSLQELVFEDETIRDMYRDLVNHDRAEAALKKQLRESIWEARASAKLFFSSNPEVYGRMTVKDFVEAFTEHQNESIRVLSEPLFIDTVREALDHPSITSAQDIQEASGIAMRADETITEFLERIFALADSLSYEDSRRLNH